MIGRERETPAGIRRVSYRACAGVSLAMVTFESRESKPVYAQDQYMNEKNALLRENFSEKLDCFEKFENCTYKRVKFCKGQVGKYFGASQSQVMTRTFHINPNENI